RHTSFSRDWSSDVCSSDLLGDLKAKRSFTRHSRHADASIPAAIQKNKPSLTRQPRSDRSLPRHGAPIQPILKSNQVLRSAPMEEIGRASCRERVEVGGVDG